MYKIVKFTLIILDKFIFKIVWTLRTRKIMLTFFFQSIVKTGIPINDVATGGPGLSFITMPLALTMMPFPQLWSLLFFFMLFLLGLDTCVSINS